MISMLCEMHMAFVILAPMKFTLVWILCLLATSGYGQAEDEFLPEVRILVVDSTEKAAIAFCKEVVSAAPGYKFVFADKENVMWSGYFYENGSYETLKFGFQFTINEVMQPDSTMKKSRVVQLIRISAELTAMTSIYNYIFNTTYTPDNIMAISVYDKPVSYKGTPYNSTIVADDMKVGYWILSFFKL